MPVRYAKRRVLNRFQIWKANHLTLRNLTITLFTFLLLALGLPVLIFTVVGHNTSNSILKSADQLATEVTVLVVGSDDTSSEIVESKIQLLLTVVDADKVSKVVLAGLDSKNGKGQTRTLAEEAERAGIVNSLLELDYASIDVYQACKSLLQEQKSKPILLIAEGRIITRSIYACSATGAETYAMTVGGGVPVSNLFHESFALVQEMLSIHSR